MGNTLNIRQIDNNTIEIDLPISTAYPTSYSSSMIADYSSDNSFIGSLQYLNTDIQMDGQFTTENMFDATMTIVLCNDMFDISGQRQ